MPTIAEAAEAMRDGDRSKARQILTSILADDLHNVDALLWMAAASDTADERRKWLLRVLEIDPNNRHALKGLEALWPVSQPVQVIERHDPSQAIAPSEEAPSQLNRALSNPTVDAPPNQVPTIDASNVSLVTGIIVVSLIILGLLWVGVGIGFFNMVMPILIRGGNPQQVDVLAIISFILAGAHLFIIRGVLLRLPSTDQRLALVTIVGCFMALLSADALQNPLIIIAIPLYIVDVYLFSTIKGVFAVPVSKSTSIKVKKSTAVPIIILAAMLVVIVFIVSQLGFYTVQPIGAFPEGVTLIVWRYPEEPFFDSPDALCIREQGYVSLICRAAAIGVAPVDRIVARLPYQEWTYLQSTGGKTFSQ